MAMVEPARVAEDDTNYYHDSILTSNQATGG